MSTMFLNELSVTFIMPTEVLKHYRKGDDEDDDQDDEDDDELFLWYG